MSFNELFNVNDAIGTKGYVVNLVILSVVAVITKFSFENYLLVYAKSDTSIFILNIVKYFLYFVYFMLLFSLVDRRLFDIAGKRAGSLYKILSSVLSTIIVYQIICITFKKFAIPFVVDNTVMQAIAFFLDSIYVFIVFMFIFPTGKITSQEKYVRRKR